MAANTFQQASGSIEAHFWHGSSSCCNRRRTLSVKMCSRSPAIPTICTGINGARKVSSTRASTAQSLGDAHQLRSISNSSDHMTANETKLMLLRSIWSGDSVEMSTKTLEDVIEAGMRISSFPVDVIYTSSLMGAQMTAVMAMSQHPSKKTLLLEGDRHIPLIAALELFSLELFSSNSNSGGNLDMRTWGVRSLDLWARRVVPYFREHIEPQLQARKNVLVTANVNALRSIIMHMDNLTAEEVVDLKIVTSIPKLYIYEDGKFIKPGNRTN